MELIAPWQEPETAAIGATHPGAYVGHPSRLQAKVMHAKNPKRFGSEEGFSTEEEGPAVSLEEQQAENAKISQFATSGSGQRRNSVSAQPVSNDRLADWKGPPVHQKSFEESERIKATIKVNESLQVLFGHLEGKNIDAVVGAMFARQVEVGDVVIQQGADGDYFYIVDRGVYDIYVKRQENLPEERVMTAEAGQSFGELALMYNVPRAATVRCVQAGQLWCLDRECFQMLLITTENIKQREYTSFLSNVQVLNMLNTYELAKLNDLLTTELMDYGEEIVKQGEEGDAVYFLYEGECKAYMDGEQGEVEVKHYTQPGEFFGELTLLHKQRQATVRVTSAAAVVLKLDKKDMDFSIASLDERLKEKARQYEAYEAFCQR